MADKKTTKTAKATEVKTIDQLQADLTAKQNDLIEARRGHKLGEFAPTRTFRGHSGSKTTN